jgi:hypothetical protein
MFLASNCEMPESSLDYTGQKGKVYDAEGNTYKTIRSRFTWSITKLDDKPVISTDLYYKSTFAFIGAGVINLAPIFRQSADPVPLEGQKK